MLPLRTSIPEITPTGQSVAQLLQAAENDFDFASLIRDYRAFIVHNRTFVHELVFRSIHSLHATLNGHTLQKRRIQLSRILNFTEQLFPNVNLGEWLQNPGPNISDDILPLALRESFR